MIIRICLCIPTFNNHETIEKVILDCLKQTEFPILVVDDGSEPPIQPLLRDLTTLKALEENRLRIIRFSKNRGKGAALQAALKDCIERSYTHLFAVDGDGQHLASEIQKLVIPCCQNPWNLIIGNRKFDTITVPEISKFGRNFSNFWVNYETGTPILDSQSGFRIYPLFHLQNMTFWTKKYDFEIEVLIRLLWKGVQIQEVEIDVYYPPKQDRISHFNKLWDNVRISILNTLFVIASVLRMHRSPKSMGLALGLGVFIGCTPFFGFHSLIVAGIAPIFRLNAIILWIGTQISIPPLAPLIALASVSIGKKMSANLNPFLNWLLGSLCLGAALGLITAIATYFFANALENKLAKKGNWSGKMRGGKFGNWILKMITYHLGLRASTFCLYFIIPYFYIFAPKARKASNEYWRIIEPQSGLLLRQWKVLRQLFTFAQTLLDRLYQSFFQDPQFEINSQGSNYILDAVKAKDGLILLSAHVGSWDLASLVLASVKLSEDFHTINYLASESNFETIKGDKQPKSLKSMRSNLDPQPLFKVKELLDEGLPVALLGDRPLSQNFEMVSFFGKIAPFDITPFRIAAVCRKKILFTFGFKSRNQEYAFYAEAPKTYQYALGTDKMIQNQRWAQSFAKSLEKFLKQYPEQWFNFYPFWSSLPDSPMTSHIAEGKNYLLEELDKRTR